MSSHIDGISFKNDCVIKELLNTVQTLNLSYGELSKITGIPKSTLHRYLSGNTNKIPYEAIRRIIKAVSAQTNNTHSIPTSSFPAPQTLSSEEIILINSFRNLQQNERLTILKLIKLFEN